MTRMIRPALVLFALLCVLTGLVYPLLVAGIAHLAFPAQAEGSVVVRGDSAIGSSLIGQNFADPRHFWGRPSATTPQPYNALSSGGSNFGPINPALTDAVRQRIEALRAADPGNGLPIPVDLVTASASGLDPDISPAAARYQAARIARVRAMPIERVEALVAAHTRERQMGLFGETRVNVLELNLALDREADLPGTAPK
jgi:K+-transporting ATPase ATPase C chain